MTRSWCSNCSQSSNQAFGALFACGRPVWVSWTFPSVVASSCERLETSLESESCLAPWYLVFFPRQTKLSLLEHHIIFLIPYIQFLGQFYLCRWDLSNPLHSQRGGLRIPSLGLTSDLWKVSASLALILWQSLDWWLYRALFSLSNLLNWVVLNRRLDSCSFEKVKPFWSWSLSSFKLDFDAATFRSRNKRKFIISGDAQRDRIELHI